MPVITLYKSRLEALIPGFSFKEICEVLPYAGLDIEELTEEYVKLEYTPNRPDLSTDYGVARALKGILGIETGLPKRETIKGKIEFIVDESVKEVRPFVAGFVVRGLSLDDETIRQIISMQEDLHEGIGRRRRKLAIGLHDISPLTPPIIYTTVKSDFKFVPLNEVREMSVKEILETLPTGIKYRHIVDGYGRYPILIDSKGVVLSLPPIINGNATRVTERTRDMLIDLTGTDEKVLEDAAAILAEALADAGGKIETITVVYKNRRKAFPPLDPIVKELDPNLARELLGVNLTDKEIEDALRRCRFNVYREDGKLKVEIPRYRIDILHEVDLVEEVGYGYGYHRLQPLFDFPYSEGRYLNSSVFYEKVRDVAIGLGFTEVMNFILLSKEVLYTKLGRDPREGIRVESTKSIEHEYLRDILLPGLLLTISYNVHEPQPHKFFEIGEVFARNEKSECGIVEKERFAAVSSHPTANYTEAKSNLEALLRSFIEDEPVYRRLEEPYIFEGRGALVMVNGRVIAKLGEIHPRTLSAFNIRNPTSFFELDLQYLMEIWEKHRKRI